MRVNDVIHLGLLLSSLAAAYLVPFELLLLAYVVLGPAHYITEISWLHDRNYFLPHRGIAASLVLLAVVGILMTDTSWLGIAMWGALIVCAILAASASVIEGMLTFVGAIALSVIIYSSKSSFFVIGVLLPTLVHVSLFTLVFMAVGAHRAGSWAQAGIIVVYLFAIAVLLLVPPTAEVRIESFAKAEREYFDNVGPALGKLFSSTNLKLDTRLTGLLAFVYTYHYLNWFIKTEIIRWADVSKSRLVLMIFTSVVSTGLYFYNYTLGFILLLVLSLTHVLLEFPLNALALRELGGVAATGLRRSFGGAAVEVPRRPPQSRSSKPKPPRRAA